MNDTKTEPTTRTEYGVKRTWPDGMTEYRREDTRAIAESTVRMVNGHFADPVTATLVTRTVTTTPWTQV